MVRDKPSDHGDLRLFVRGVYVRADRQYRIRARTRRREWRVRSWSLSASQLANAAGTYLGAALGCLAGGLAWRGDPFFLSVVVLVVSAAATAAALSIVGWPKSLARLPAALDPSHEIPKARGSDVKAHVASPGDDVPEDAILDHGLAVLVGNSQSRPDISWWDQPHEDLSQQSQTDHEYVPVDLDRYKQRSQIAQCPACGNFRLDVSHPHSNGYSLRCVDCGHFWSWTPGTSWPGLKVDRTRNSRSERMT